jgi:hypothetical protein
MATRNKSRFNWSKIRALWESGESSYSIAKRNGMPTHGAIDKRKTQEEWTRNLEGIIQQKVAEKVAGLVAGTDLAERTQLIDKESKKRADIEIRHRDEPGHVRGLLYTAIKDHKDAGSEKDEAKQKKNKRQAAEDLKTAKLAMEVMKGIQEMERKSYRLDSAPTGTVTFGKIEWEIVD